MERREQAALDRAVAVQLEGTAVKVLDVIGQLRLQEAQRVGPIDADRAEFGERRQDGRAQCRCKFTCRCCKGAACTRPR
jgi:hypothetical protein